MGAWYGSQATLGLCQPLIAIMQRKPPAMRNIGIDRNARSVRALRCDYEVELVHGCCHRFLAEFPFAGDELVYSDPPDLHRARKSQRRYDYTQADHEQLLALFKGLPCAVMLSGYPFPLYEQALQGAKEQVEALRKAGRVSPEADAVFGVLMPLLTLLLAVLLEKTTRKNSGNSSVPPSQLEQDETARRAKPGRQATPAEDGSGSNLQKITSEQTLAVTACDRCGADLSQADPIDRERRVLYDIVFQVIKQRVEAEVKQCPDCRARSKAQFPANMSGPVQYGTGPQALIINLLVAHMLSLRRTVELVWAISGLRLSEAACLGYIRRLHEALQAWEDTASARLLAASALHADETGPRVEGKNHWLHILTDGSLTLKFRRRKRGKAAIEAIGLIPRFGRTLVHDCWASHLGYQQCRHALSGAHLIRELSFIVESNNYRWARRMKALQQEACHLVNGSHAKALRAAACEALRKRYRSILAQGGKELPALPPRAKGQRGRIAESDAHNLHERLVQHEEAMLRFLSDPHVSFTNNCWRARTAHVISENESVGLISHASLWRGLCPHLQLPAVHGRARLQSSRHQPNRARRQRCRHGQATRWPDRRLSSYMPRSFALNFKQFAKSACPDDIRLALDRTPETEAMLEADRPLCPVRHVAAAARRRENSHFSPPRGILSVRLQEGTIPSLAARVETGSGGFGDQYKRIASPRSQHSCEREIIGSPEEV